MPYSPRYRALLRARFSLFCVLVMAAFLPAYSTHSAHAAPPPAEKPTSVPSGEALEQALVQAGGSISAAARRLGCSRQQLYRCLELRGMSLEKYRER